MEWQKNNHELERSITTKRNRRTRYAQYRNENRSNTNNVAKEIPCTKKWKTRLGICSRPNNLQQPTKNTQDSKRKQDKLDIPIMEWNRKKDAIPKFINEIIKVSRKYKVGYDILEAGPKPRRLLPIWHHIGIEDNYSWNKKLATCLRKEHKIVETGQLEEFTKSNSTHWFCKRLAKKIIDKITEPLRPGKEINQEIPSTPTRDKNNNLSSRTDIIKIDPRIVDNRTPEKAIKIFGDYPRYKKRNNKENNFLRPPIEIKNQNTQEKTIWITEIPKELLKEQIEQKLIKIGWKEKKEINEEETYRFFKADNNIPKEEIEILLITEAMKEKGKITIISNLQKTNIDIHDKMEQWEQLDYLETKNGETWNTR